MTALLLLVPLAAAGSVDDPEVVDPAGDHVTGQQVDPVQALDVLAIFLTEEMGLCDDATEVTMAMQFNNIVTGNSGAPGAWFSSSIYFTINENEYRTYLRPAPNLGPITEPWIYMYDITADSDRMVINGGVDNSEDEKAWWCVPYENLNGAQPGDVVTNLWGRTYIDQYGPADLAPDGAPDSGEFGREYVLGGVVPSAGNVSVAAPENATEVAFGASTTFAINVTNHADDNDTITFAVENVTEGWDATIDPANVTVAGNESALTNLTVTPTDDNATTGTFTVTYNSTLGVSGNLTFTASLAMGSDAMDHMDFMGGNETGNGTAQDADDQDALGIPGVGPLLVLGVAFVVAAAHRRRR